ncbi:MAG: hypothetical protein ACI4A3_13885 [Lachnospiraceae bacterium]
MRLSMNRKTMAYVLILFLMTGMVSGCGKKGEIPVLNTPVSESLQGIKAERKDINEEKIIAGYVAGSMQGYYYTEYKQELDYQVSLGEEVAKGQALVSADNGELKEQLESLKLELENAKAQREYQKEYRSLNNDRLKLQKKLADEEEKQLLEDESERAEIDQDYQMKLLDIRISDLNREIADINDRIKRNTLYAKKAGRVSYISYTQSATEFQNVLIVIDVTDLYILLEDTLTEENKANYIRAYTTYKGKEQELKEFDYSESEKKAAEKNSIALTPRFQFADADMEMGDYMDVHIVLKESKNAIVVPKTCIYKSENDTYVYRINGETKEKCFVETGVSNGAEIEITDGVNEGDLIYYPVDEKVEYTGKQKVIKGSLSLQEYSADCRQYYPSTVSIFTGAGEAELICIAESGEVEKGELLAKIKVSEGQADVKELENQLSSLKKQYQSQQSAGEKTIKLLKKSIKSMKKEDSGASAQEIALKEKELSIAELEKDYHAGEYERQKQIISRNLESLREKTGEISIYAPCTGTFDGYYSSGDKSVLRENDCIGMISSTSVSCIRVDNSSNRLHFGNAVTVRDPSGKEYNGYVAGAYSSGEIMISGSDEYGNSFSYAIEADETQKGAYIKLEKGSIEAGKAVTDEGDSPEDNAVEETVPDEESIMDKGRITYLSNVIENVIVIDQELLVRDGNDIYVWTLREGKPYKQYVKCMNGAEKKAWVFWGLEENDTLLTGVK